MKKLALLLLLMAIGYTTPALAAETRIAAQGEHGHQGTLVLDRAPLVTMQPTRLELQLTADPALPLVLRGRCDLTMPAMPMPPNRPTLRPLGTSLVGEAIFTMAGNWRVSCAVEYADRTSELFVFNLDRVLMK